MTHRLVCAVVWVRNKQCWPPGSYCFSVCYAPSHLLLVSRTLWHSRTLKTFTAVTTHHRGSNDEPPTRSCQRPNAPWTTSPHVPLQPSHPGHVSCSDITGIWGWPWRTMTIYVRIQDFVPVSHVIMKSMSVCVHCAVEYIMWYVLWYVVISLL